MLRGTNSIWLSWTIIFAQMFVLVLGPSRVVICYDDGGSSHIELVDDNSCITQDDRSCDQPVATQGVSQQVTSLCSDTSCVDKPLGLLATLTNTRSESYGQQHGVVPPPSLAIVQWLILQDPMDKLDYTIDFDDRYAIASFHQSKRSTVLVL